MKNNMNGCILNHNGYCRTYQCDCANALKGTNCDAIFRAYNMGRIAAIDEIKNTNTQRLSDICTKEEAQKWDNAYADAYGEEYIK